MTDQKIEEIRGRAEKATPGPWHWSADDYSMATLSGPDELVQHVVSVCPCKSCQAALSEAEKELGWKWGSCTTPDEKDASFIAHAREDIPYLLSENARQAAELATLKASGTFSEGIEAAAKWHEDEANYIADKASFDNADRDGDVRMHLRFAHDIRALSPQPRPDAQAQRERELALIHFVRKDIKGFAISSLPSAAETLEAFDRSQS